MVNEIIPDRQHRIRNAENIGARMYSKSTWEKMVKKIRQLDENLATLVQELPYGTIFSRKQLNLANREIASITILVHLNLKSQLKSHIIAALRLGISKAEIIELFLHLIMFIGFPVVLDAFYVAKEVFDHYEKKGNKI